MQQVEEGRPRQGLTHRVIAELRDKNIDDIEVGQLASFLHRCLSN